MIGFIRGWPLWSPRRPLSTRSASFRRGGFVASMHVKLIAVGRRSEKEAWAEEPVEEYMKRLGSQLSLSCEYVRDDAALVRAMGDKKGARNLWRIALDANGLLLDSARFADLLFRRLEQSGGRVAFFVGGAEGLSDEAKSIADETISLSRLTFTHKLARLVIAEQIYRASEIRKGTKYDK